MDATPEVGTAGGSLAELYEEAGRYFKGQGFLNYALQQSVEKSSSATDIVVLTEKDTLEGGEVLQGFKIPIAEIFGE